MATSDGLGNEEGTVAKVLLVEDDRDIRTIVELALEEHTCLHAGDGKEALSILDREDVDLIILDIMMPEVDGIETLRRIRSNSDLWDVRVIMLTAKASEEDHLKGFRTGADAYLTKPFDLEELRRTLSEVMGRSPDERDAVRQGEVDKATFLREIERRFNE